MNTSRKTDVYSMDVLLSWTREINHHTKNMMVSVINSKRGKLFMENIFKEMRKNDVRNYY